MKKKFLTLLAFVCGLNGMKADEGMWMLSHISPKSMKVMKDLGLQMSEKELYNTKGTSLKDAVVSFGGFWFRVSLSHRMAWSLQTTTVASATYRLWPHLKTTS